MFTFLAALRHNRIDAPCVLDGPIKAKASNLYCAVPEHIFTAATAFTNEDCHGRIGANVGSSLLFCHAHPEQIELIFAIGTSEGSYTTLSIRLEVTT
jgi:hypothetical protein